MKQLIIFITLLVVTLPQLSFAEEEVIWETEQIPYLHGVLVAPQGEILYNLRGKDLQIRRIDDGVVIDSIIMENIPNYLYQMSITDDGRYMAFSGDNPYLIIYDLQERKEVKRITTIAYERDEYGKNVVYDAENWVSSSISPDGTKITGIVNARIGEMTNFVVIDIATEKVLYEQRRIIYDHFNPEKPYQKWQSTEYSPDGKYIINQLEFKSGSDSVYIFDANTFEVYDILKYNYSNSRVSLVFDKYKERILYIENSQQVIYNIQNRTTESFPISFSPFSILFSLKSNHIIYGYGFNNHIFDLDSKKIIYEYDFVTAPKVISLDNSKMFGFKDNKIYAMKTFFTKSTVETNPLEIIISPNPTNGSINISFTNKHSSSFQYELISNSGQIVQSGVLGYLNLDANSINMDISTVSNGQYLLRVYSEQEEFVLNVIKED